MVKRTQFSSPNNLEPLTVLLPFDIRIVTTQGTECAVCVFVFPHRPYKYIGCKKSEEAGNCTQLPHSVALKIL